MPRKRVNKNKKVALSVLNPDDSARIDIGATEIYVAVPADRDPEPVRMFATFTHDLNGTTLRVIRIQRSHSHFEASGHQVNRRLVTLHYLDTRRRPRDIEKLEGRTSF